MNSPCVHVVQYTSLCTSSTLHTLSIFSCKFNFSIPVFPDFTMPRAARTRRHVSNTVNPASMKLGQLLALPPQSLVLLASARHLVTTGSKARLAERIHACEHAIPPPAGSTDAVGPNNINPPSLTVNGNETSSAANAFSECRSPSCDRSSRPPFIVSALTINILQSRSKDHCFLL